MNSTAVASRVKGQSVSLVNPVYLGQAMLDLPYLDDLGTASIREIEQDFAAGQSMSKSLLKASRRIDCGDRCAKLVAGN